MTKQLNILFLKRSFLQKGGLEKQANLIVNQFANRGHKITIFTEEPNPLLKFRTIICKKISGPSFLKTLHFSQESKKFTQIEKFDAIFAFDRTEEQTIMRLGNGLHKSFLIEKFRYTPWYKKIIEKNPQDYATLYLEKKAFESKNLNTIIANSEMVKNELLDSFSVAPEKVHVIHNGVEWYQNENAFEEQFSLNPKTYSLNIDPSKVQLLFLGHGFKRKGLDFLLKALAKLNRKDFHLHVVGHDKNLPYYKSLSNNLTLLDIVTFHGACPSSKIFYQIADLCIIPSLYDPFANVTVEAFNFGCPVLSSKKNGGSEIIKQGMGCMIDNLDDTTEFSKLILSHLKKKNYSSALEIRNKVEYLDFKYQLDKLLNLCEEGSVYQKTQNF